MKYVIPLALALAACGEEETPVSPTFTSIPELAPYAAAMVERYARATGRMDIAFRSDGDVPIYFEEDLESLWSDGAWHEDCAHTNWTKTNGVFVAVDIAVDPTPPEKCDPIQVVVLHEGLHALAPAAPHTEHGMFAITADGSRVDDESLTRLCEYFDCSWFQPE